jgi:hypothetical protein
MGMGPRDTRVATVLGAEKVEEEEEQKEGEAGE